MEFLFTRRSYVTKNKVQVTPAYHLFRGNLLKTLETTRKTNKLPPYLPVKPSAVSRFSTIEKLRYMRAFDWSDVENCDPELLAFTRELKSCNNIWGFRNPWPIGREKLLTVMPYMANSRKGSSFSGMLNEWNATELPLWATQKVVDGEMLKRIDKLVGSNYTRIQQIQFSALKLLRERLK